MFITVISSSPEETFSLGKKLAGRFHGGEVVALTGGLGAGKTVFAKGVASALGVKGEVLSPTFTIVREYAGCLKFNHFDFYRLSSEDELAEIGFSEYLSDGGVALIEWADLFPEVFPKDTLHIDISPFGEGQRKIRISGYKLDLEAGGN